MKTSTFSKAKPVTEDLKYGFSMTTWWFPLGRQWLVQLLDPIGNVVDVYKTIREDCVKRNQVRMREKSERWFPEGSSEDRAYQRELLRIELRDRTDR